MNRNTILMVATAALFTTAAVGTVFAQCGGMMHSGSHTEHASDKSKESAVIVYPIDFCIVSGEKLGEMGDPVKYEYKDRTIYFCCKGCIKKFEAEPAKYIAELDAAAAKSGKTTAVKTTLEAEATDSTAVKTAPKLTSLDWCIVTGDKLGEMGKPVPYKYKDRELTFCCKGCIKEFEKTPAAYLARLDSALAGQIKQPAEVVDSAKADGQGHSHH